MGSHVSRYRTVPVVSGCSMGWLNRVLTVRNTFCKVCS